MLPEIVLSARRFWMISFSIISFWMISSWTISFWMKKFLDEKFLDGKFLKISSWLGSRSASRQLQDIFKAARLGIPRDSTEILRN